MISFIPADLGVFLPMSCDDGVFDKEADGRLPIFIGVLLEDSRLLFTAEEFRDRFPLSELFLCHFICGPRVSGASILRALFISFSRSNWDIFTAPEFCNQSINHWINQLIQNADYHKLLFYNLYNSKAHCADKISIVKIPMFSKKYSCGFIINIIRVGLIWWQNQFLFLILRHLVFLLFVTEC